MAIVLPIGLLSNPSHEYVREYVENAARIIGVVSLDPNTFRPFTSTPTGILFLKKWTTGDLRTDYPIFFGNSERPGKDSSGNFEYLQDGVTVDSDLPHLARAMREFVEDEGLGF